MRTRRGLTALALLAAAIASGESGVALAAPGNKCPATTLNGLYVFSATGFTTATDPAQPKAIVEWIRFNGDGTLDVPGATRSLNGVIAQIPPGGTGSYTIADLVPPDGGCMGTLTFLPSGPHFNLFIPPKAAEIWMIQTDANNVFQGTATRVSR